MERVVYVAVITVLLGCGKLYISVISDPVGLIVGVIIGQYTGRAVSGIISAGVIMYSQTSFIRTA